MFERVGSGFIMWTMLAIVWLLAGSWPQTVENSQDPTVQYWAVHWPVLCCTCHVGPINA